MVISKISVFIFIAKAFLLVLATPDPENYRLPSFYEPIHYTISLRLNPELFKKNGTQFNGEVTIRFSFNTTVNYIALHSHHDMIKLEKVTFEDEELPDSNYSVNNVTDILTIKLGKRIIVTNKVYHLFIKYTGKVSTEDLYGLYKSSYVEENKTKYLLTTQLGSTFTRRVFPLFDEPGFKTKFNVTIIFPNNLNVIFNTNILNTTKDVTGMNTTIFQETPIMPAGSLAFVVSDFTCSGSHFNITALQVCSREDKYALRRVALDMAVKFLQSLNRFTGYSYNQFSQKLDIVGVPDFPAYAASGLGLQIHRHELLIVQEYDSYDITEQIMYIMAHELAHQWFGNLLSCNWYSEMFMDEGLARFLEFYTVNEAFPNNKFDDKRFVMDVLQTVLVEDGKGDALPLRVENVTTPSEIMNLFTEIPYNKGSSIIRMVSYFMTLENFRKGIQNYIERHTYGIVDSEDLWSALSETIDNTISRMPANLSTVMKNWTTKTGYPLVTVSVDGRNLTISQSRFSYSGLDNETKWYIPISYTQSDHLKFLSTTPDFWLTPEESNLEGLLHDKDNWIILNNHQIGYYRVNYDTTLWTRIKNALQQKNFDGIIDINRAQVVDDLFNFARADMLSYSSVLDTIRFLKNDTSYYPWKAAIQGFELLLRRVGEFSDLGKKIGKDMLDLFDNFYNDALNERKTKKTHRFNNLKVLLIVEWACRLGNGHCIERIRRLFQSYKWTKRRPAVEVRPLIYCNGLRYSNDVSDWNFLWTNLIYTDQPSEQIAIRTALACTRNVTLLRHYLQMTITEDSVIRPQDTLEVFLAVASNPVGVDVALNFLMENQELIVKYYQSMGSIEVIFLNIMDRLSSEEQINKTVDFINDGGLNEEFKQFADRALFAAESTRAWLRKYSDELEAYYYVEEPEEINYWWLMFLLLLLLPLGVIIYFYCWRREQCLNCIRSMNLCRGRDDIEIPENIEMNRY